jgi:hypothetical protein
VTGQPTVGANGMYTGPVAIGTRVEVELVDRSGGSERLGFDVVTDSAADFSAGFLGASTPLARAIIGRRAGAVVPYHQADVAEVRILAVAASQRKPNKNAAAERDAIAQDAIRRSDLEDAVRLALTVNVKWGDYDPEGLEQNWVEQPSEAGDGQVQRALPPTDGDGPALVDPDC